MALDRKKVLALYLLRRRLRLQPTKRRFWTHPIFANRKKFGAYYVLLPQLKADDDKFFNYFRMTRDCFDRLLQMLDARLSKTSQREPIGPEERLMVTLRFLASGDSYRSLSYAFRLADNTISLIVRETCSAIYSELKGLIRLPSSQEEWLNVERGFRKMWNFPHVIGAVDGKHIQIKKPPNSGSLYFNFRLSRARRCIENTFGIMAAKSIEMAAKSIEMAAKSIETSHEVSDAIVKANSLPAQLSHRIFTTWHKTSEGNGRLRIIKRGKWSMATRNPAAAASHSSNSTTWRRL
ncbi:putative nuclease HARBI1 [Ditylenchus destructor]|nr:putative nuclease HARBI1 [Ditylenchus destructor]